MKQALTVVAGVLGLIAASLSWATVAGGGFEVRLSGADVTGGLGQALAATTLAGAVAQLLLRGRARLAMGVIVALLGVAMVIVAVAGRTVDSDVVRAQLRTVSLSEPTVTVNLLGPVLFGLAGALAATGALLTAWGQGRPARFERKPVGELSAWEQIDRGMDPTVADSGVASIGDSDGRQWTPTDRKGES